MDRKEFLTFKKPASPTQIKRTERRTNTGLATYSGTFGKKEAMHLLRRSLFGVKVQDMKDFSAKSMAAAVDTLLNTATSVPNEPLNYYGKTTPDPNVAYGTTWVNSAIDFNFNFQRTMSIKAWWWEMAARQPSTIMEKMVMFWHNLIPIASAEQIDPRMTHLYLKTIRQNAMGNFKSLVRALSIDPAMLVYLNGRYNTKRAPDENYARELLELFTLGKGPDSKYTEDDVKAAARVLTGWNINPFVTPPVSTFTLSNHDTTNKQFSAFFNNKVVTGRSTATAGTEELDELLNMIFAQTEVAKFICRKLYKYFVYYDITPDIETNIITPLADHFRNNNYEIKPLLDKLLKSEHFFDSLNMGCVIKDPTSHIAGFCRQWELDYPTDVEMLYGITGYARAFGQAVLQDILDPPSVAGWPAWHQSPQYLRSWISSDSLPKRNQFTDLMLFIGYKRGGNTFIADVFKVTRQFSNPGNADTLIADAVAFLLPLELSATQIAALRNNLLPGGIPDYNWTDEWNQANDPGHANHTTALASAKLKLQLLYKAIMNLSEYQLS
jgi:uncharacterized protein (DUF1800 family)